MAYKRQVSYWDLVENGQKKGNSGFCKWEQKNGVHTLSISIQGLYNESIDRLGVYTKAAGSLGELNLRNGRAAGVFQWDENEYDFHKGIGRIWIPLSQGRELETRFGEEETETFSLIPRNEEETEPLPPVPRNEEEAEPLPPIPRNEEETEPLPPIPRRAEETGPLSSIHKNEKETTSFPWVQKNKEEITVRTQSMDSVKEEVTVETEREVAAQERSEKSLWEAFAATNEKIRPFGTKTEYYRIALEDIYRLKDTCHILRNNQFLLHGYYNYRYLILGKKEGEENAYWLGVPGIYHEREKMAARMYGFEKFEGVRPDYRVGDLGYYLISAE